MLAVPVLTWLFSPVCRSNDSDETTKRKVNLVFEKIQTLKSRATAGSQSDNKVRRGLFYAAKRQ